MAAVKRILFVDDEPKVLEGLQRMLYPLRKEWHMEFVCNGREALRRLAESEFQVLVTDMRMPEMPGPELLAEVHRLHPQMVRIVLSGTADRGMALDSVALAHQYLAKPCDAKTLRGTVDRALSLRVTLENPELRRLIASIHSLPSVPSLYLKVIELLKCPDSSAADIGRVIAQDLSMSAKVLQLVNSAFFGIGRRIADPAEAVAYLGIDTVRSLVLTVSAFSQFEGKTHNGFCIEQLRDHSVAVASLAREIAKSLALAKAQVDDSFTGGLMHDVGKLVLACNFPDRYREIAQASDARAARQAEIRIFGADHSAVGAYLLWLWGLPESVTEVVACHHMEPQEEETTGPFLTVCLADSLIRGGAELECARERAERLGLISHFDDWQAMAGDLICGKPVC
jgi:putative nucleotidyltransferase with HDIG domain